MKGKYQKCIGAEMKGERGNRTQIQRKFKAASKKCSGK